MVAEAYGLATVNVATSTGPVVVPRVAENEVGEAVIGTSSTFAVLEATVGAVPGGSVESAIETVTLYGEPGTVSVV